jgi:DNA polymerase
MTDDNPVILDFETYFDKDYTLRKMSSPEFILDKRFKVHGLAVDDGRKQDFLAPKLIPPFLKALVKSGRPVVVHNGFFDLGILAWHYKVQPKIVLDTLLMANHVLGSARDGAGGKNDLATLAEKFGLEAKGEIAPFLGVRDLDKTQFAAMAAYAKRDASLTRQVFNRLLARFSRPEFELWLLSHTLELYVSKTLRINPTKLKHTLSLIHKRREEIVAAAGVPAPVLNSNKKFAEVLIERLKLNKTKVPMKVGKRGLIPALAKGDPGFAALVDHKCPQISGLVRARLVERSAVVAAARVSVMQKYHKLGIGIPVHLVYYGAHTGRFSGGGGFNFQNLTSPARASDPLDREIAASIRESVEAEAGKKFVPVDAAQIEARVEAWLAGEDSISDAFSNGVDVYSAFISDALGQDIHKPTDADPPEKHSYLKLMRHVGKEAVLGLGYSMGVDKFRMRLQKEKNIAPHLDGDKAMLSMKVCAGIVHGYREKYKAIVQFWTDLQNAFEAAARGARRSVGQGKLIFQREEPSVVSITLPSKRKLYYHNVRRVQRTGSASFIGADGTRKTKDRSGFEYLHGNGQHVYGGLLAENVTQAVARDILAEAIWEAEQAGYPVVLHVHDEVVCQVPTKQGQECLDFLIRTLSTPPEWGAGLVLSAEGHVAPNLSK